MFSTVGMHVRYFSFHFYLIFYIHVLLATRTIAALTPQFAANDNAAAQGMGYKAKHNNNK